MLKQKFMVKKHAGSNLPSCLSVPLADVARFLEPLSLSSRSELRRESEAPATFDIEVELNGAEEKKKKIF